MSKLVRHFAMTCVVAALSAGAAQAATKTMDAMGADHAATDCLKKARMEKDTKKMAMMEKRCAGKDAMHSDAMKSGGETGAMEQKP